MTTSADNTAAAEVEDEDSHPQPTYQDLHFCVSETCEVSGAHREHEASEPAGDVLSDEEVADAIRAWHEYMDEPPPDIHDEEQSVPLTEDDRSEALMYWQGRTYFTEAFLEQEFGVAFVGALRSRRRPVVPRMSGGGGGDSINLPVEVTRVLNKAGSGRDGPPMCVIQMQCELDDAAPWIAELTRLIDKEHLRVTFNQMDPTMIQRSYIEGADQGVRVNLAPPVPPSCQKCGASMLDVELGPVDSFASHSVLRCLDTAACDERHRDATAQFEESLQIESDENTITDASETDTAGDEVPTVEGEQADERQPVEAAPVALAADDADDWGKDAPPPKVDDETAERIRSNAPTRGRRTSPTLDREATHGTQASTRAVVEATAPNGRNDH